MQAGAVVEATQHHRGCSMYVLVLHSGVFKPCRPRLLTVVVIIIPWGLHVVLIGLALRHLCIHPFRKLETVAPSGIFHRDFLDGISAYINTKYTFFVKSQLS